MITTMTQKGQVTVPVAIRKELGLQPGHKVSFSQTNGVFEGRPVADFFSFRGSIKSKRKFSQKLNREWDEAIGKYLSEEHLKKRARERT